MHTTIHFTHTAIASLLHPQVSLRVPSTMSIPALLATIPVTDIKPTRALVTLDSNEASFEAYARLADANIRSAPVFDAAANKYIGFLDVRDLIQLIVYEHNLKEEFKGPALNRIKYLTRMVTVGAKMFQQPGTHLSLAYLARRHPFRSVDESATLADVVKLLIETRCHRVPVVDVEGKVVNVISQSSIIQFLYAHKGDLGAVGAHTVEKMACGTSPVYSVQASDTIFSAFELMAQHDIMGVAIVGEDGKLIANTSASDFKEFLRDPTTSLHLSAIDFISKVRQHDLKAVHPAMSVHLGDPLVHVIGKFAATKVHRVFVVNDGRLLSVMSLSDVMKYALNTSE